MEPAVSLNLIAPLSSFLMKAMASISITSPAIPAYDAQFLLFNFRYLNLNEDIQGDFLISYNGNDTWYNVLDFSQPNSQPIVVSGILDNPPDSLRTIRIKWRITYLTNDRNILVIDDIAVHAIHHEQGQITGFIQLENPNQDVTQVRLSLADYPEEVYHPATNGSFTIPAYQGIYPYLKAEMDECLTILIPDVAVVSSQTTSLNANVINFLRRPVNLQFEISEGNLSLNWGLETLADSLSGRLAPNYYLLAIDGPEGVSQDSSAVASYSTMINPGIYRISIRSAYLNYFGSYDLSRESDLLIINNTSGEDNQATPPIFNLRQNYPNPFRAKTSIEFSLSKTGQADLTIYNAKGETVRKLLNNEAKSGVYKLEFNGLNNAGQALPSGIYYYRLVSGGKTLTRKLLLLK